MAINIYSGGMGIIIAELLAALFWRYTIAVGVVGQAIMVGLFAW